MNSSVGIHRAPFACELQEIVNGDSIIYCVGRTKHLMGTSCYAATNCNDKSSSKIWVFAFHGWQTRIRWKISFRLLPDWMRTFWWSSSYRYHTIKTVFAHFFELFVAAQIFVQFSSQQYSHKLAHTKTVNAKLRSIETNHSNRSKWYDASVIVYCV